MFLLLLLACADTDDSVAKDAADSVAKDSPPKTFSYPLDDVLRLNHVQLEGTHNSYHLRPDPLVTDEWDYEHPPLTTQFEDEGVRMVELDVHYQPETDDFAVHHIPGLDYGTTCTLLYDCLSEIRAWSDAHPAHVPLLVLVEPKDDVDQDKIAGHYDRLDAELDAVWPADRRLSPDDIQDDAATPQEGLAAGGWPTLGELRGKVLFAMIDTGEGRAEYTAGGTSVAGRVMFSAKVPEDALGVVAFLENPLSDAAAIAEAAAAGFLIRSTDDDDPFRETPDDATAALDSGAHFVSSDFPIPAEGYSLDGYELVLDGATPGRCNPVTAPPECTAAAIEDPAFME